MSKEKTNSIKKYNYQRQFIVSDGKAELPEVVLAKEKSFAEGRQVGIDETKDAIYNNIKKITEEVEEIRKKQEISYQYITSDILKSTQVIIDKLFPYIQEKYAKDDIICFVEKSLSFIEKEGKVTIYIHPNNRKKLEEYLKDFPTKLYFKEDNNLAKSDCKIEWNDGGIEKLTSKISDSIENAFEEIKKSIPERKKEEVDFLEEEKSKVINENIKQEEK